MPCRRAGAAGSLNAECASRERRLETVPARQNCRTVRRGWIFVATPPSRCIVVTLRRPVSPAIEGDGQSLALILATFRKQPRFGGKDAGCRGARGPLASFSAACPPTPSPSRSSRRDPDGELHRRIGSRAARGGRLGKGHPSVALSDASERATRHAHERQLRRRGCDACIEWQALNANGSDDACHVPARLEVRRHPPIAIDGTFAGVVRRGD
jgi:hypothetical protein